MSKLNISKINSIIREKKPTKVADGNGLYFVHPKIGKPYWVTIYSFNGRRREVTIGPYYLVSLAEARDENIINKKLLLRGEDPKAVKERKKTELIMHTLDDVFELWYQKHIEKKHKHPQIIRGRYMREISPCLGKLSPKDIKAYDIEDLVNTIMESGRKSIGVAAFNICQRILSFAETFQFISRNPIGGIKDSFYDYKPQSRWRTLSEEEIKIFFKAMRDNPHTVVRENYLACCLYLVLGVRNRELIEATWDEFDLENHVWSLPAERSKNGHPLDIPLPTQTVPWLLELKAKGFGSNYVFPARRRGNKPTISPDTILAAIHKLMGNDPRKPSENKMPGVEPFVIHDFRRTFRTFLTKLGVDSEVGAVCLNHRSIKHNILGPERFQSNVEAIYNRYDYFNERREAHQKIADYLAKYF